jgi:hypothetical protein
MKRLNWQFQLAVVLIVFSALVYFVHYLLFRDYHHIFLYLVGDIAFVPIEVLLVTLIIHRLLTEREKREKLRKLNMVIGAFFNEVGTELMGRFISFDVNLPEFGKNLLLRTGWKWEDFNLAKKNLGGFDCNPVSRKGNLPELRYFLGEKRDFLTRLLENPVLLEHESFTELLWAVFHLADELFRRKDVSALPDNDYDHLSGDMKRAYVLLVRQWLDYMSHLSTDYPYLYSLAVRTNPFDPEAKVILG